MTLRPEDVLLQEILRQQAELSQRLHEMARAQAILSDARTQLRLGKPPALVLAEVRRQSSTLLAEWTIAASRDGRLEVVRAPV